MVTLRTGKGIWVAVATVAACLSAVYGQAPESAYEFPPLIEPDGDSARESVISSAPGDLVPLPRVAANTVAEQDDPFGGDPMALHALIPPAVNTDDYWRIYKTEWSAADERGYQAFVTAIGRSDCTTLDECIRDEANPYRDLSAEYIYHGDCADMAYFLRAYYAWKNGLPYTYQHVMATADGSEADLRYSDNGNIVIDRRSVTMPARGKPLHAPSFLQRIGGEVSTAMFRTHPEPQGSRTHDDFYPVEIDREHVVPGAIAYDVFGHVGLVYEVTADGRVLIVASHPDHSVTRSFYGPNFLRTGPDHGGGLKGWRPVRLVGATRAEDGTWRGGRIEAESNDGLPGFSLIQYYGNGEHPAADWQLSEFVWQGRAMGYYDYVRHALAARDHRFDPVDEMRTAMQGICSDIRARRVAVDRAVRHKVHLRDHPGRLPPNIYGTYGTWEAYSTPSRDARLKTAYRDLKRITEDAVAEAGADGPAMAARMLHAFEEEENACRISYRRMDESLVRLSFGDVMDRLFDMSFDPYHCPERRWGASGSELATCEETPEKAEWYSAQRYLRNQIDRTYDVAMGFSLEQLASPQDASPAQGGLGVSTPPDLDTHEWLEAAAARHPLARRASDSALGGGSAAGGAVNGGQ